MSGRVIESVQDGVLVLEIDNPPVNAISATIRASIVAGAERLEADPMLVAAVLIGSSGSFVAGSDISEFDGVVPLPLLPDVISAIERSPKPVIAALDGFALGGGLELALGCDGRVATPNLRIGLPEVTLGIVPGAGGTQRLPRLIGRAKALEIVLSGRRLSGAEAHRLGIVDELVDGDLRKAAVRFALTSTKSRVADLTVPYDEADLDDVAMQTLRGPRRPNIGAAIDLIRNAGVIEVGEALRKEREIFDHLRVSDDAQALRHVFFAERAASRRAAIAPSREQPSRVGIIGAGAMGADIGTAFALAGVGVQLIDTEPAQVERGLSRLREAIDKAIRRGRLSADDAAKLVARLGASTDYADLGGTDLVIEAVVENADVKASVLRSAATYAPHALLATNTSYLSVTELSTVLKEPGQLIGMHFFNPADVMKLLEIVPGAYTSDDSLAFSLSVAKMLGKTAVIADDREGFIGNRIYSTYRRHAEFLLEDGAMPSEVDAAMEQFGFAMGPFAVADLSGLQIAQSLRQRWRNTGRLPARYVEIPDLLCERGWLGRQSGRGYYRYEGGHRIVDAEVQGIIVAESARKGIKRRKIGTEEIVSRMLGAMVVEGARAVRDGTALHVDDVDVAMVNGFGFPRFTGGPMWWARQLSRSGRTGLAELVATASHEATASITDVLSDV